MKLIEGLNTRRSLVDLLVGLAAEAPNTALLRYRAGDAIVDCSAVELLTLARQYANGLHSEGVRRGDRVAFLLPNGVDAVAFWFAVGLVGAVEVPINTDLRGPVLAYVLRDSEPTLVVVDPGFVDAMSACGADAVAPVLVWGEPAMERFASAPIIGYCTPARDSLATIMYTSGTTGPSKGVMLSSGYFANIGRFLQIVEPELSSSDVLYICTPMFHVDARLMMSATLVTGATFAFAPRFGVSSFWSDVHDFGVSFFVFVGAMVSILAKTSTEEMMAGSRLRSAIGGPTPPEAYATLEDRWGVRLMEGYGLTECDGVTWSTPDRRRRGTVGWESGPYEVRTIGVDGAPVPPGEVGEIVVRPGAPELITMGYWHHDEATMQAFRNGWFHTGDLGCFDHDGFLSFVGRAKEVIRRRGENVSTFEIEMTLNALDTVLECAAVGVPDELGGEEEILIYVVPRETTEFDASAFFAAATERLARFAVPRYLKVVTDLPHTPTGKVAKRVLSVEVDEQTFDRLRTSPNTHRPAAVGDSSAGATGSSI